MVNTDESRWKLEEDERHISERNNMSEGRSYDRNNVPLNFMGHFPEEYQLFEAI